MATNAIVHVLAQCDEIARVKLEFFVDVKRNYVVYFELTLASAADSTTRIVFNELSSNRRPSSAALRAPRRFVRLFVNNLLVRSRHYWYSAMMIRPGAPLPPDLSALVVEYPPPPPEPYPPPTFPSPLLDAIAPPAPK